MTEYLCYKLPRICLVCRNHNEAFDTFMTYKSNTTRAISGGGTDDLPEHLSEAIYQRQHPEIIIRKCTRKTNWFVMNDC